jgi:Flp pilus assembly protein TadD
MDERKELAGRDANLGFHLAKGSEPQSHNFTRAVELARKAVELEPKNWGYWNLLGAVHVCAGDWSAAQDAYRKALELGPDQSSAAANLANFLATCPDPRFRDAARAVELAQRAVEQAPDEAVNWRNLGMAQYRARDWKAAVQALEKALELRSNGKSSEWHLLSKELFFLAMAQMQLGDKEQARTQCDKAMQWMEQNPALLEKYPTDHADLRRFRAEAAALLGLADVPMPTAPQERPSKDAGSRD